LQDLLESFTDGGDFLPTLRNDERHQFFHLPPGVDPASVAALEHNFDFLIQLTATFAPEPVYPHHSIFQASLKLLNMLLYDHVTTQDLRGYSFQVVVDVFLTLFQAAFIKLADKYGIFPARTTKKVVKAI